MKVAFGLKAHSGWAALVVGGDPAGPRPVAPAIVERRRIDLVGRDETSWAKAPYHAAEELPPAGARVMVERGIAAARRGALRAMREAVGRARDAGHEVAACAVLMGEPMPDWTTDEILAVHFRMHKAEGVLFRDVLARAAGDCGLRFVAVPEKGLDAEAARVLKAPAGVLRRSIAALRKSVGPPWGRDQQDAAIAALIALRGEKP
jgi:hypothetical protein